MTLKFTARNAQTRHALLRDFLYDGRPDDRFRDIAETRLHLEPGSGVAVRV
jgi:hypothetical protein